MINRMKFKPVPINASNRAYFSLQQVFKKRSLSKSFKIRLYRTNIIPMLIYGCEAQTFRLADKNKLETFEKKKVLRRIFGPVLDQTTNTWRSLKNSEIESRYAAPNVNQVMKKRRLKYAGHVARTGEDRMPKRVMLDEVSGRRSKGGQNSDGWTMSEKMSQRWGWIRRDGWRLRRTDRHRETILRQY